MIKFKIEKGITPPRRGPKPKIDYSSIPLDQMKPGDSIKLTEIPKSRRNSTYLTVTQALEKRFAELGGGFSVSTTLIDGENCEVRVWKLSAPDAPRKAARKKKK